MSYILEALRKSQQERELGRVPTLDGASLFPEEKADPPRSLWPMLAVGLAGIAVLIALYAALRGPAAPVERPVFVTAGAGQVAEPSMAGAAPRALGLEDLDNLSVVPRPLIPGPEPETSPTLAVNAGALPPPVPNAQPLIEPPPPKVSARSAPDSSLESGTLSGRPLEGPAATAALPPEPPAGVVFDGDGPIYHPDLSESTDLEAELALQEQLDAELAEEAVSAYADAPVPIPPDLIADIEAFKREAGVKVSAPKAAAAPRAHVQGDPTKLTLTPAQAADLPAYLMTVHVFDQQPARRFVLINGMKYKEGSRTREGLTVERIIAEGAVLSHQGNAFFVAR